MCLILEPILFHVTLVMLMLLIKQKNIKYGANALMILLTNEEYEKTFKESKEIIESLTNK